MKYIVRVGFWGLDFGVGLDRGGSVCGDLVTVRVRLWVPIKTNQGSGVAFGTCLLLRSLALYPESSICICHLQTSYSSYAGFKVGVAIKAGFFPMPCSVGYVPYGKIVKKSHQKKDQKI